MIRRRLRGDLIETFKILSGKECVHWSQFFDLADVTSGLRGHSLKLFNPRCSTTVRQNLFSLRVINEWNKLRSKLWRHRLQTHLRTDWTKTRTTWASSADQLYSPATSIRYKCLGQSQNDRGCKVTAHNNPDCLGFNLASLCYRLPGWEETKFRIPAAGILISPSSATGCRDSIHNV